MKNKFLLMLLILLPLIFSVEKHAQNVELLGVPGPVAVMKINPNNSNNLLSSDAHNGSFFRTTDGGITNEWIDLGNFSYIIGIIACDYSDTNVFFAGADQVFKTIDGGKNWMEIFQPEGNQNWNYNFETSPVNSNILFSVTKENELWKSYNSGESWFKLATFNEGITQISLSHQDTSLIFVATENHLRRSTNSGESWELTMVISQTSWLRAFQMQVNPYNDEHIDYIIEGEYNSSDLWRSTDGGYSLNILFVGEPFQNVTDFATDFSNPSIVYVTFGGSLFKTTDAGKYWESLNNNFPFDNIEAGQIEMSFKEPNILYVSTRMGIYKTTNGGVNWFLTHAAYTNIYHLFVSQEKKGTVIAGTRAGKIMKTTDFGENWYRPTLEPDETGSSAYDFFSMNPFDESVGFMASGVHLFKTSDYGDSWFNTNLLPGASQIQYHPYKQNTIFAIQNGLFRSLDNGMSWNFMPDTSLATMVSNNLNHNNMFSLTFDGVRRSTDLGMSWELTSNRFEFDSLCNFNALAMPSNKTEVAYTGAEIYNSDYERHLLKTTNFGKDWFSIDSSLSEIDPFLNIQSIVIDEKNPKRMFVGLGHGGIPYWANGTNGGLYLTEDDGKNWIKLYDGTVNLIRLDYNEPRYIYIGTKFGLMRMQDSLVTEVEDDTENILTCFSLNQNYPNPFNPSTTIEFTIPKKEEVQLNIFNSLGQKIAVLIDEPLSNGNYRIDFNGQKYSSGVYFYQLKTKNYCEVKKMLLLK